MPSIAEHRVVKAAKEAGLRVRETVSGVVYIYLAGDAQLVACMNLEETRIAPIRWAHPHYQSEFVTVKDALILIKDSTK